MYWQHAGEQEARCAMRAPFFAVFVAAANGAGAPPGLCGARRRLLHMCPAKTLHRPRAVLKMSTHRLADAQEIAWQEAAVAGLGCSAMERSAMEKGVLRVFF